MSKKRNTAGTLAARWMEGSLDDSAIRIDLPETFILTDAIIDSLDNVTDGHRHLSSGDSHACPGATAFHVHGKYCYETGCQGCF